MNSSTRVVLEGTGGSLMACMACMMVWRVCAIGVYWGLLGSTVHIWLVLNDISGQILKHIIFPFLICTALVILFAASAVTNCMMLQGAPKA
jgi:energy-converting hydrogenase Eha subunit B